MDFGAEVADRSYQEIPTGALRPRNDILGSASERNDKLKLKSRITQKPPRFVSNVSKLSWHIPPIIE